MNIDVSAASTDLAAQEVTQFKRDCQVLTLVGLFWVTSATPAHDGAQADTLTLTSSPPCNIVAAHFCAQQQHKLDT